MAQSGYTPILIYGSGTATNVPLAANLTSNSSGVELALNYADGKLFYKDSGGVVQLLASKDAAGGTFAAPVVIEGSTTDAALRVTQTGTGNALLVEDSTNPDSTPFVIDANGTVIVGATTNSQYGLSGQQFQEHVSSGFNGAGALFAGWNATQPNYVNIARSVSGTVGTSGIVSSGVANGIRFLFDDGTAFIRGAEITAAVDGTPGTNDMPGRLIFSTTADGASSPTERMRINSSGGVGIGATSASSTTLRIGKTITGATTGYGISNDGVVQSDVTASASYFRTATSTQATSFTVTDLYNYEAGQSTIGAGSTVTNQYGFAARSSLTGATNNYGFYGNIASGTGRYNFYAAGNADNYFAGSLGLAGSSTNTRLRANLTISDIAATTAAIQGDGALTLTASNANVFHGVDAQASINQGGFNATVTLQSGGSIRGARTYTTVTGASGTVTAATGLYADVRNLGAGTLTNAAAFTTFFANSGGGTLTNAINYYAPPTTAGTNNYGFYGDIASGTGRWNLYINGTANNYMAGSLGIGTTSLTARNLYVAKTVTGATTAYGVRADTTFQSDVTSGGWSFYSVPNTQAAAFTITEIGGYVADNGTIGAGSTVTKQYGFYATSGLTGATNNYGFYSNIASGTGRWNFYAGGTADNYFAGKVGIGTSSPAVSLAVSATDAVLVAKGTTAQRPTGVSGYLRFNTDTTSFEGYNGTAWAAVGGGNTTSSGLWENAKTISTSYSITSGNNAMSAGPLTINSGVTVTVPSGSVWTII